MPYEFMGSDLESEQGQQDFLSAYEAIAQIDSEDLETFQDEWSKFLQECKNPMAIKAFVTTILQNKNPDVRKLALHTETLVVADAPSAVRGLVAGLFDQDEENRRISRGFVEELIRGHQPPTFEQIGLGGLAQIAEAYRTVPA